MLNFILPFKIASSLLYFSNVRSCIIPLTRYEYWIVKICSTCLIVFLFMFSWIVPYLAEKLTNKLESKSLTWFVSSDESIWNFSSPPATRCNASFDVIIFTLIFPGIQKGTVYDRN